MRQDRINKMAVATFMGWRFEFASEGKPYKVWNPSYNSEEMPPDDWSFCTWIKENFEKHIDINLGYNSEWQMLMPVVEKIESIANSDYYEVDIFGHCCDIGGKIETTGITKIDAVFKAVVQFIQWHNTQPTK